MASKLEELSRRYQVIVVGHLGRVARGADERFRIEKQEGSGRSLTSVELLSKNERVEEIARMLTGEKVTETALANAREMLS